MPDRTPVPTFHHKVYPSIDPTNPELSLKGKTVLVTGGGSGGIGATIAQSFSIAGAANIIIIGRRHQNLIESKTAIERTPGNTSKVHAFQGSITSQAEMASIFKAIVSDIGPIDVLVANAGAVGTESPLATASLDDIREVFEVNVIGSLNTVQEFLKAKAKGPVTIVSINSFGGTKPYFAPWPGYVLSKATLIKLMEGVAKENEDVRVFSIQPGVIQSQMSNQFGAWDIANDDPALAGAFCVWLASPKSEMFRDTFLWSNWDVDELLALNPELEKKPDLLKIGVVGETHFKYTAASPFDQ